MLASEVLYKIGKFIDAVSFRNPPPDAPGTTDDDS